MANFKGTVRVNVDQNITLDNLHSLVARITKFAGCPSCGLLGVELRLLGDPVEKNEIAKAPGVTSVGFGA